VPYRDEDTGAYSRVYQHRGLYSQSYVLRTVKTSSDKNGKRLLKNGYLSMSEVPGIS
jgi:hypothetical protein